MKLSQLEYRTNLPVPRSLGPANLLIYDRYFEQDHPSLKATQNWIKKFPHRIGFFGGEELKDLHRFPQKMEQILELVSSLAVKNVQIVSLGGGSLGDFSGFVASILKRGLPLIHIPTTWLAAIDSAHGGKTALNVSGFKNQIGSFYPADKVILCKSILFLQPPARAEEAFSEAFKIALLSGGKLWKSFSSIRHFDRFTAWKFLPQLIESKYRIVQKDPYEKKGLRQLLNLGHTLGHVWEAQLKLSHGRAVGFGLRAAIELSQQENILRPRDLQKLEEVPALKLLPSRRELWSLLQKAGSIEDFLLKDKKISEKNSLRYIFIQKPGKCFSASIPIQKLVKFHRRLQTERPT